MKTKKRRPSIWPLALSAVGLLLLAFLVWFALGYLTKVEPTPGWQDPVLQERPDGVEPRLALLVLAGWSRQQVVDLALSEKAWETAYAILVHDPGLSDRERAGLWLLLGRGFAEAGQPDRAFLCYRQAEAIAVLSPVLSDYVRADALSQAALGAAQIGQTGLARRWAEEAQVLLESPTDLQPVLRQQMVDRLAEVYRVLGEKPPTLIAPKVGAAGGILEPLLPTLTRPVDLPEVALRARQEREAAARQALQRLAQGTSAGGEWQAVLARVLQQEDQVMESALHQAEGGEIRFSVRAGWMQKRVEWLSLKYQVARRGFGISLVPAWEERAAEIRSDLARAYQDLFGIYQEEVVALPTADLVKQGWVEVLREEAKAGMLGLYPNYPEPEVAENLVRRMDEWLRSHPEAAWRIATVQQGGGVEYVLVAR
ncbi:MAG: hypothetical protein ACUVXH_04750 [Anaerolineae bacterium]